MTESSRALVAVRHLAWPCAAAASLATALAIALLALVLAAPLGAQPADGFFRPALMPKDEATQAALLELQLKLAKDPTVLRSRLVEIDVSQLEQQAKATDLEARERGRLQMNFFDDVEAPLVLDHINREDHGFTIYHGEIEGTDQGTVVLVGKNAALAGTFEVGERFFSLRSATPGIHVIEEIDRLRFDQESEPLVPEGLWPTKTGSPSRDGGLAEVDIVVAYTTAAREAAGGVGAIQQQIVLAIAQLDATFLRSAVDARARLAGLVEIGYQETGSSLSDLQWLRTSAEVKKFRESWQGDVVSLFVEQMYDACGIGYLMGSNSTSFAPWALNVVRRACSTSNYTFAHEVGHNLGGAHDRLNSSFPGAFPYSYGYQALSRDFRTVMAYDCPDSHCPRILNFSNPAVTYLNQPTGVSVAAPNSADNALTFTQTSPTAARFSSTFGITTFGNYDVTSGFGFAGLDPGYSHLPRFLADVNGDQRADYCRFVGDYHAPFLSCGLTTAGGTFGQYDVNSGPGQAGLDLGYADRPRFMVDVNADQRADYCRFVGDSPSIFLSCALATAGATFGQYDVNSGRGHAGLDKGYAHLPRFMVDVNADERADYCRFVGDSPNIFLSCALATASGTFGQYDVNSGRGQAGLDQGYAHLPKFMADVNADQRADYCRFVGNPSEIFLSCALATASGTFGQYDVNSARGFSGLDPGVSSRPRFMVDVNGDERADYCRFVGDSPFNFLSCALATESGTFGNYDINSRQGTPAGLDFGYAHLPTAMADVDASGQAAYCRFVGNPPNLALSCAVPILTGSP